MAAAARGVDDGAAAPGGGGGDGSWCGCSEINHQKKIVKIIKIHTPQPWPMPNALKKKKKRKPRAVITARNSATMPGGLIFI